MILAYTMPWVTETLGDEAAPQALTVRMMEASDRPAKELDKDMTPEDRARWMYLLHTLSFHYNPDHMEIAENAATEAINNVDLAQKATATTAKVAPSAPTAATPATEPHQYLRWPYLCKILCYNFIISARKKIPARKRKASSQNGDKELQKNGFWLDVTEDMALQRLEAYSLFSDVADQHKYENHSQSYSILLGTSSNCQTKPVSCSFWHTWEHSGIIRNR